MGGVTTLLALAQDVISVATLHVRLLSACFTWLHGRQLGLLSSLALLFRGRKRNVLRGRNDSAAFSGSQLLFGTLLFTVLAFLFPTTLVYHAFLSSLTVIIIGVAGALEAAVDALNTLPVYAAAAVATGQLFRGAQLTLLYTQERVCVRSLPVADLLIRGEGPLPSRAVDAAPVVADSAATAAAAPTSLFQGASSLLFPPPAPAVGIIEPLQGAGVHALRTGEWGLREGLTLTDAAPASLAALFVPGLDMGGGGVDSTGVGGRVDGSSQWTHSYFALRPLPVPGGVVVEWVGEAVAARLWRSPVWPLLREALCGSSSAGGAGSGSAS